MEISFLPEEEVKYRRFLMKAAAKGDVVAQLKLWVEYHVRVYSASERGRLNENHDDFHVPGTPIHA